MNTVLFSLLHAHIQRAFHQEWFIIDDATIYCSSIFISSLVCCANKVGENGQLGCNIAGKETGRRVFATLFAFAYVLPLLVIGALSALILGHIAKAQRSSLLLSKGPKPPSIKASCRRSRFSRSRAMTDGDESVDYDANESQRWTSRRGPRQPTCRKRHVTRLLVLVVVVFAIFWLPIHVHLLLAFFYHLPHGSRFYLALSVLWQCLAYFNSCVNPIIYNHTSKDFRDAFRSVVGCLCHGCLVRQVQSDVTVNDGIRSLAQSKMRPAILALGMSSPEQLQLQQQQLELHEPPMKRSSSDLHRGPGSPTDAAVPPVDDEYYDDDEEEECPPEKRLSKLAVLGQLRPMIQCPDGERITVPVIIQLQDNCGQRTDLQ